MNILVAFQRIIHLIHDYRILLSKYIIASGVDLEMEINVLGKEISSLSVADRKAQQAEQDYKIQLLLISEKLNSTEVR